jgi:zinc protease
MSVGREIMRSEAMGTKVMKLAALVLLAAAAAAPARAQDGAKGAEGSPKAPHRGWQDLKLPPVRQFSAPKPVRREIDGMVVYLLEDHELPTIDLVAVVNARPGDEPREKAGLAAITGEVMRSGGIFAPSEGSDKSLAYEEPKLAKTGDEIDEQLESMAASAEVSIGTDQARAGCSALKENFPSALETLVAILERPAFREDKIALAKKQHKSAIARRNDDAAGIAHREFRRAMYGDENPYGWTEEVATIDAITRDELVRFHREHFRREATIVGVVGDFQTDDMAALIARAFAKYPKAQGGMTTLLSDPVDVPGRVLLVKKPDVNQSTIYMGHVGIQRRPDDPDYCAAVVADTILGRGGFAARLLQHVRTDLGLAYGVYSNLDAPYGHRGLFYMECQTKCTTTLQAINAMKKELEGLCTAEPSAEELRIAKESILQSLVFASESRKDVIERALRYEYYGFPQDYLEKFQAGIAAVTAADALRVAKKLLHPDRLTTLVVGNDATFDGSLESLGKVTVIDVKKPAFAKAAPAGAATTAAFTPEAKARAQAIINAAVEAHGGRAALERVKAIREKGTIKVGPMAVKIEALIAYPDRLKQTMQTPMGLVVQCCDGKRAWAQSPMGLQDAKESEAEQMRDNVAEGLVPTLLALADGKLEPTGLEEGSETETEGGKVHKFDVLRLGKRNLGFDRETHRLVIDVREVADSGAHITFGDYREVAGVLFAFEETAEKGPQSFTVALEEIVVNPEIPADAFARPAGPAAPEEGGGAGAGD